MKIARLLAWPITALAFLVCLAGCGAGSVLAEMASGDAQAQAGSLARAGAAVANALTAAKFDYYVLALSWSPQHCTTPAGRRDYVASPWSGRSTAAGATSRTGQGLTTRNP